MWSATPIRSTRAAWEKTATFSTRGDIATGVVNAFNADMRYVGFHHRSGGPAISSQRWSGTQEDRCTGMYAIGNWGNGDADKEKVLPILSMINRCDEPGVSWPHAGLCALSRSQIRSY
jgi:hypothetical protein